MISNRIHLGHEDVSRSIGLIVLFCAGSLLLSSVARSAEPASQASVANASVATTRAASPAEFATELVYDRDYPFIGYSSPPQHNDIAHLIAHMRAGQVKLEYAQPRGYLDSLLHALHIDPDSQVLVFSKTSLQTDAISARTPRAIYFNDDTYVAWIEGSKLIETTTMDSMMGTVFYTLVDQPTGPAHFERETTRCLQCHDTFSESGGGVPNFLFLSAYSRQQGDVVTNDVARHTSDETPLADRWGGWYVTGDLGGIPHLGNILPASDGRLPLSAAHPRNLASLDALFDTKPYLTDKSDVVALLVLQHQVDMHNLIIHANYKCRMLMERHEPGSSTAGLTWAQLTPTLRARFEVLLDPLVQGMLMVDAAKFPHPIRGTSGFTRSFEARGPRDSRGRSLRDLDLDTRLFKYPLSFLIYSEGFDYLPGAAKEYVYRRLDELLTGSDRSPTFSNLSTADRRAILEILRATKPDFVRTIAHEADMSASAAKGAAAPTKG
jgi:hypothetical protein